MTDKQIKERELLYQGLNWWICVDGSYTNMNKKEPMLNHLYEVALACKSKSDQLQRAEQKLEKIKELCQKHIKAEKIVMASDILQKISEVIE